MTIDNAALRQFILQFFSDEELDTLCFDYFPEVQQNFTGGMTKNRKALQLIGYCETRGRLADLYGALARERETGWNRAFGATPVETGRRPVSSLPHDSFAETAETAETGRRPVSTTSPDRRIHAQTSIELIRIPAGPFLYGSTDDNELAFKDQKPQRVVDLPEFWIGRTPITNAQFARFVAATDYRTSTQLRGGQWAQLGNEKGSEILGIDWQHPQGPGSSLAGKDDHPVTFISWYDAQAFCDWARLALPQQEQWEKAARGTDGRLWPWGNEPPTEERCNFDSFDTTPVGLFSPQGDSPYGCVDMIGNVWEWTASVLWRWPPIRYGLRGGAYYNDMAFVLNPAYRWDSEPEDGGQGYGFRVIERIADGDF